MKVGNAVASIWTLSLVQIIFNRSHGIGATIRWAWINRPMRFACAHLVFQLSPEQRALQEAADEFARNDDDNGRQRLHHSNLHHQLQVLSNLNRVSQSSRPLHLHLFGSASWSKQALVLFSSLGIDTPRMYFLGELGTPAYQQCHACEGECTGGGRRQQQMVELQNLVLTLLSPKNSRKVQVQNPGRMLFTISMSPSPARGFSRNEDCGADGYRGRPTSRKSLTFLQSWNSLRLEEHIGLHRWPVWHSKKK